MLWFVLLVLWFSGFGPVKKKEKINYFIYVLFDERISPVSLGKGLKVMPFKPRL